MACESERWLRTPDVLAVVIADWELGVRTILVGVVHDADIAATEDRAFVGVVRDGKLGKVQGKLFSHVHWEDEGFQSFVSRPLFLGWAPSDGGEASNYLAELSLCQEQGVALAVTLLMELLNGEIVLWGSEKKFEACDFAVEQSADVVDVTDYLTGEDWQVGFVLFLHWDLSIRKGFAFPLDSGFEVQIAGFFQQFTDFFFQCHHFIFQDLGKFNIFHGIHLVQDGVDVKPVDLGEVVLGHVFDEPHHFDAVTVGLDPEAELGMFWLDFGEQVQEEGIDSVADVIKVGRAEVGVIVDEGFNFWPEYFGAVLMEQAALIFVAVAVFTEESGFAAGGADAGGVCGFAVDALGAFVFGFCCHEL